LGCFGHKKEHNFSDIKSKVNTERLRDTIRQELAFARMQTDRLFEVLAPAAIHERPIPERHRIIFYLGHLEAFDWNMVCRTSFGMPSFNADFDRLFEFGIDPVDGKLPQDVPGDWPAVREILSYKDRVRDKVDRLLERATFDGAAEPFVEGGQIFHVAIEHRLMHAETLSYMFQWLDGALKRQVSSLDASWTKQADVLPHPKSVRIPGGVATLGQERQQESFGWDNEFQAHSVFVPEFSIDAYDVTNYQFLEFVQADGYNERSFWTSEDWGWIQQSGIRHPRFWIPRGERWFYRNMFEEIPMPGSWPVYVSYAEASAYARWKGKSLPTEAQYHRAAFGSPDGTERMAPTRGNFNFQSWSPEPAGASPEAVSAFGVFDLVGNGWEWTSSLFAPFDGFQRFPFYPGYSADFFDGKHYVLKGASPRTASLLTRRSFRNWFQPHYPYIYATFRCVEN
jgi:iron(II)-dependent oxidoreductase